MEQIRGNEISMIFQEPMTSLNPLYTVGRPDRRGDRPAPGPVAGARPWTSAVDMLRRVYIPEPEQRAHAYPHQLSGGMRQRVMIAMALSCNPKVLIADEPTTALDVTIQAQILELMRELQETYGIAIVLITHDMGVVAENADRVRGDVCRPQGRGGRRRRSVRAAGPSLHARACSARSRTSTRRRAAGARRARLNEIKGMVPSLFDLPQGCSFAPRCGLATDRCRAACAAARAASARPLDRLLARRPPARGDGRRREPGERAAARSRRTSRSTSRSTRALFSRGLGPGLRRRRRVVHASAAARRWGWSARAAAASRRSAARC